MKASHQNDPPTHIATLGLADHMDRLVASESAPAGIRGKTVALTAVLC
jgi:hypothetical protein